MGRAIVAGLLINGAYFLVLYAYSVAPLSIVSPLRESAVVLATAWGSSGSGEREGAVQRIGGAVLTPSAGSSSRSAERSRRPWSADAGRGMARVGY